MIAYKTIMKQTVTEKGVLEDKITVSDDWINTETTVPVSRKKKIKAFLRGAQNVCKVY